MLTHMYFISFLISREKKVVLPIECLYQNAPGVTKAVIGECIPPWLQAGMIIIRCIKQLKVIVRGSS